jgi:ABC-2 type transport system ATP-binding protein
MRRRVAIAQALLGKPELILLDEPTSGLDPALVAEVKDILRACRGASTLIVSSHVLADLEAVCDHVVFMKAGRCTKEGDLAEVTGQKQRVRVKLKGPVSLERLAEALNGIAYEQEGNDLVFQAPAGWELPALNAKVLPALLGLGAEILEVGRGDSLEAAYMADLGRPEANPAQAIAEKT